MKRESSKLAATATSRSRSTPSPSRAWSPGISAARERADWKTERVRQFEAAAAEVKLLLGLLPICAYCKSIRSDDESWQPIERYIGARSDAQFTHSICPDCRARL